MTIGKVDVTGVVSNARRLAQDAKLLKDNERYASAYALAVLSMEETGKMLIKLREVPGSKSHISKQRALSSLFVADWVLKEFGPLEDIPEEQLERVARAVCESSAGQLHHLVELTLFNKAKELAFYHHDNWEGMPFQARVTPEEVEGMLETASAATKIVDDNPSALETGALIFRATEEVFDEGKRQRKVAPIIEALVAIIEVSRAYLPGEIGKDAFTPRCWRQSTIRRSSPRSPLTVIRPKSAAPKSSRPGAQPHASPPAQP